MQTEDILMCPGPNEIADRVLRAMMRPAACPIVGEFPEFYEQTLDMLAEVFQTRNEVIPLPGSGRSGLEGAITSVLEPGDPSLTIVSGVFGETAIRIANAVGGKAEGLAMPWGEPIDLHAFEQKLSSGSYKLVTMVHNETSTGALYDAAEVSRLAHEHGALFLLDAISSLAGADLPTDAWDVDLVVGCNHKAIGAPIGHAYVAVSERAWDVMAKRQQPCGSVFSNLLHWKAEPSEDPNAARSMKRTQGVFTAVHLIYALNEALTMILEEGLEARFARHRLNAAALRGVGQRYGAGDPGPPGCGLANRDLREVAGGHHVGRLPRTLPRGPRLGDASGAGGLPYECRAHRPYGGNVNAAQYSSHLACV